VAKTSNKIVALAAFEDASLATRFFADWTFVDLLLAMIWAGSCCLEWKALLKYLNLTELRLAVVPGDNPELVLKHVAPGLPNSVRRLFINSKRSAPRNAAIAWANRLAADPIGFQRF